MINKLLNSLPSSFNKEPGALLDFLAPIAQELTQAQSGITSALDQMLLTTADGEWLDEWGGYFGIPRLASEPDAVYKPRIISELIQPKGNNIALQNAISLYVNGLNVTVTDAPVASTTTSLYRDGATFFDGKKDRQSRTRNFYGQFDVNSHYDLTSSEILTDLSTRIKAVIERLRDAGTKLRTLAFTGSLSDAASPGVDASLLHQLEHAPLQDLYRGARPIRDGSLYRGAVQLDTYGSNIARNGLTLRDGFHVLAGAPTYGDEIDPASLAANLDWQDSFAQTVTYGSGYERDGTMNRRGTVSDGLDLAELNLTKVLARDGRYSRGSVRDGSLRYNGVSRTFGTVFYGGAISWSESL